MNVIFNDINIVNSRDYRNMFYMSSPIINSKMATKMINTNKENTYTGANPIPPVSNVEESKKIQKPESGEELALQIKNQDYSSFIKSLTPEQKDYCLALAKNVNKDDLNSITEYGKNLNKIIASNGEALLAQSRNGKKNEIIELTDNLLLEIKDISIDDFSPKKNNWLAIAKHIPIVRKIVKTVEQSIVKYDTVASNVTKISEKMNSAKSVALRDNDTLQDIFDNSLNYIQEIKKYIVGGKLKLEELENQLSMMQDNPAVYEQYEVSDLQNFITLLQKRVADMQTTEYILSQNLLQIKAAQSNNLEIVTKSENITNHVIPIWKSQLALSMIMNNQKASVDAQKKIQETTQEILKKNSISLKNNTVEMAKQSESSIIEVETIKETTQKLIECMNEVQQIHKQGEANRKAIEEQLKQCSETLWQNIQKSTW